LPKMKINFANPTTGAQKLVVVDDERKLRILYDKRMAQEVEGDALGEEYKGYIFKITGGNDKQGFPMMQGVLTNGRVRLLLDKNSKCYRPRRTGERKRKSIRGCIVGPDLSVVNLVVLRKGEKEIEGLTDRVIPRRLGPKRASKIRKLFNLTKEDDVRKYVVRREIPSKKEGKRPKTKAPKIQRLVTPVRLQRKRHRDALIKRRMAKSKADAAEYARLLQKRNREKRETLASRKSARASARLSAKISGKEGAEPAQKKAKKSDKEAKKATGKKKDTKKDAKKKDAKKDAKKKDAAKKGAKKEAVKKGAAPKAKGVAKKETGKKETAKKKQQKDVKKAVSKAGKKVAPKKEGAKASKK